MSTGEIVTLVLGGVAGIGGTLLVAYLRGRGRTAGALSAGATRRAEQALAEVDDDLARRRAGIETDRARDHAAGEDRWRVGE